MVSTSIAICAGEYKNSTKLLWSLKYISIDGKERLFIDKKVSVSEWKKLGFHSAQEILEKSPTSIKMLKFAMNLTDDGMVGQQVFAGEATRLAYMTDEAKEGRDAFLEKRKPNFKKEYLP